MFQISPGVVKSTSSIQMAIASGLEIPRRVDLISTETSVAHDPAYGDTQELSSRVEPASFKISVHGLP
jgi:hypothetical protein